MAVSPADVKKLREKTMAGMLDCKNALVEAGGDFAAAEKILKEKGLASAEKRSGRSTDNGCVFTAVGKDYAAVAELSCETDFVAMNAIFVEAGEKIIQTIVDKKLDQVNDELETMVKEAISVLKENMEIKHIRGMAKGEEDVVIPYLHNDGQIGVLVKLSCESPAVAAKEEVKTMAMDLALHAAAFSPSFLNREQVDPSYLKEQEGIFTAQAAGMGKPEKVVAGIVKGKLNKHLAQVCFVDQPFVKDDKVTVHQAIAALAKTLGGEIELREFVYMRVGEKA